MPRFTVALGIFFFASAIPALSRKCCRCFRTTS
jgi:hypothetical protein